MTYIQSELAPSNSTQSDIYIRICRSVYGSRLALLKRIVQDPFFQLKLREFEIYALALYQESSNGVRTANRFIREAEEISPDFHEQCIIKRMRKVMWVMISEMQRMELSYLNQKFLEDEIKDVCPSNLEIASR